MMLRYATDIPPIKSNAATSYRTRKLRPLIMKKTEGRCYYCGIDVPVSLFTADHIIPTARGGNDKLDNLVTCCKTCNTEKGNRTIEWLRFFKTMKAFCGENGVKFTPDQVRWLDENGRGLNLKRYVFWFERQPSSDQE